MECWICKEKNAISHYKHGIICRTCLTLIETGQNYRQVLANRVPKIVVKKPVMLKEEI